MNKFLYLLVIDHIKFYSNLILHLFFDFFYNSFF